jgi:hypothetical protein
MCGPFYPFDMVPLGRSTLKHKSRVFRYLEGHRHPLLVVNYRIADTASVTRTIDLRGGAAAATSDARSNSKSFMSNDFARRWNKSRFSQEIMESYLGCELQQYHGACFSQVKESLP